MSLVDRERLLDAVDLEQLAEELLGPSKGRGRSARWPSPVPGHPQTGKTPPMSIFTDRSGVQRWTCWATGASGTAIDLVMTVENKSFKEAMGWLDDYTGGRARAQRAPLVRKRPVLPLGQNVGMDKLHGWVDKCRRILNTPSGEKARRWLHSRGYSQQDIERNKIGFDPGSKTFYRAMGLPFTAGIVFPVFDHEGQVVYGQSRSLNESGSKYTNPYGGDEIGRYKVSLQNPRVSWHHGDLDTSMMVVCEGIPDAIAVQSFGMTAMAALGAGTAVTDEVAAEIEKHHDGRMVVVCFDDDPDGQRASITLCERLGTRDMDVVSITSPFGDLRNWLNASQNMFKHDLTRAINTKAMRAVQERLAEQKRLEAEWMEM